MKSDLIRCPRCGAVAIRTDDAHSECGSCSFYFNAILVEKFVQKYGEETEMTVQYSLPFEVEKSEGK